MASAVKLATPDSLRTAASTDTQTLLQDQRDTMMNKNMPKRTIRIAALGALACVSLNVSSVSAATLSRSADVNGTVSAVWSLIGPFCAIKDWLPPVGTSQTNFACSPGSRFGGN